MEKRRRKRKKRQRISGISVGQMYCRMIGVSASVAFCLLYSPGSVKSKPCWSVFSGFMKYTKKH